MAFVKFNSNPDRSSVGDCTIRAISKIMGDSWDDTYIGLALQGYELKDMPSSNHVWGAYLKEHGFKRFAIPNTCPDCYTIKEFTQDYSDGEYLLATGNHVVAVINGNYFDTWDSGDEVPVFYWVKEDKDGV